ncbi:MAG: MOSC domain-containing protein [Lachnospiraceae bacterium]|nr:MOSC domain-containing protein [Lachnospiraceae bacterium]
MAATLDSVCIKSKIDNLMHCIGQADLIKTGIPNDVHCDGGDLQISILPKEVIDEYGKSKGQTFKYGEFGENLVIDGLDYKKLKVGDTISVGDSRLEITKIGVEDGKGEKCKNEIHNNYIFCRVLVAGIITVGDQVNID